MAKMAEIAYNTRQRKIEEQRYAQEQEQKLKQMAMGEAYEKQQRETRKKSTSTFSENMLARFLKGQKEMCEVCNLPRHYGEVCRTSYCEAKGKGANIDGFMNELRKKLITLENENMELRQRIAELS
jgi:hypothetical protein